MTAQDVIAVVVTRNRKALLKKCLEGIISQTYKPRKILVIDNNSTDGTSLSYLHSILNLNNDIIDYVALKENTGGSGGFSLGIIKAMDIGASWIWLMDDDCVPSQTALEKLIASSATVECPTGFLCSMVLWKDGSPHFMNIPAFKAIVCGFPATRYVDRGLLLVQSCSFVSVLVSSDAIRECGLPISSMFIWGDDVEFFSRITSQGFAGFLCFDSIAHHLTESNQNDNLTFITSESLFKFRFGIRNQLFMVRKNKGLLAYFYAIIFQLTVYNVGIITGSSDIKIKLLINNIIASLGSLFFWPRIRFYNDSDDKI